MNINQILAATDLTPDARSAVERAAQLAQLHGADLHLLHVLPTMSWKLFGKAFVEHPLITEKHLYDAARAELERAADACRRQYPVKVHCRVEIGKPHEKIAEYALANKIDLTVLGAPAQGLVRELVPGATSLKLLRTGTQPVLLAASEAASPYRRVLVAVDFSRVSRLALQAAATLVPKAELHVLHVNDALPEGKMHYAGVDASVIQHYRDAADQEARQVMTALLSDPAYPVPASSVIRRGSPARLIIEEAQALEADLIVMGKHGQSPLQQLFVGSVTERVLHRLDRDLLLVVGE